MKKNRYFPLGLTTLAVLAGCATAPPNSALTEARDVYTSARSDPKISTLAPVELKEAGATLDAADAAQRDRESDEEVNHLAYLVKQKVAIARETATRKDAESAISNASAQRDQIRLQARTSEAEAARQQAVEAQQTAQAEIAARQAEAEKAKREAEAAKEAADQQAAALAQAQAAADRNETLIAQKQAEADAARQQAAQAQEAADRQAQALAALTAQSESNRAQLAQQDAELKALNAKQTNRGLVITLGDVLFSVGKAQLTSGGTRNVQKLADFLNQSPQRKVMIEGYTDSTGGDALNQALSQRRADAVKTALVGMGIDASRILTRGYGKAFPVASNNTAAGRQLNRRVEIVLSDEQGNLTTRQP